MRPKLFSISMLSACKWLDHKTGIRLPSLAAKPRINSFSDGSTLCEQLAKSCYINSAFCVTAARDWNTLTPSVQSSESLTVFRRRLKLNCSHAPSQIDYISVCSIASWLNLQPWSRLDYNVVMTFRFNNNNNNNKCEMKVVNIISSCHIN